MQRFFRVSGPAVHQMVVGLEKAGLIRRQPGVPRSIRCLSTARLSQCCGQTTNNRSNLCAEVL